ncbi:MAG: PAS domain S-box protein [Syntrophomonadaceae bacterium]|nr:PAS domain S-box protein [Syntrophomonadaceae bacterium]
MICGSLLDVIEFLPDATFVINRDKKVIVWNQAIEALTGVSKAAIIGTRNYTVSLYGEPGLMLIDLLFSTDWTKELPSNYKNISKKGNILYGESFSPYLNEGQGAFLWGTAAPLFNEEGKLIGAIETLRDITERKLLEIELTKHRDDLEQLVKQRTEELKRANEELQKDIIERERAEEALRESETHYRGIFNAVMDGFLIIDLNNQIVEVNPEMCRMLGYTYEELINLSVKEIIHPNSYPVFERLKDSLLTNNEFSVQAIDIRKDGSSFPVEIKGSIFEYKGRKHFLTIIRDISEREQVEEQLRKLSRAVEQSPSIVMITDKLGNIEYINPKFTQITGYGPEQTIGKNVRNTGGLSPEESKIFWDTISSGKEWQGEFYNRKKNGEYYWEFASISPFRNIDGVITHFIKMAEDITKRKQMEQEMARLDRLNLIGEMAAGIGHEIRNPMTTVRGFLQLLADKKECMVYKDFFDLMIEELDRANSIIQEFLSLAKNRIINLKIRNLNQIIKSLAPLMSADAIVSDKYINFELGTIPDLLLDEKEIRQLTLNLVRNGMEAMSTGGNLFIRTFCQGEEVVLAVQDKGKGIKPEVIEKLGTPFFTTKDEGIGLGLAECYSIAARHNAKIEVETDSGGTTFYIYFKPYRPGKKDNVEK